MEKETDESIEVGGQRFTPDELAYFFLATGGSPFLVAEAVASARMARDEEGQTYSLEDDLEDQP